MVCSDVKKNSTFTQNIVTCQPKSCGVTLHSKSSSRLHSWLRTHPRRKMSLTRCCSGHEDDCFQPSHASLEPVFAIYLEIQVDEKLTINGVNRAHYTESFAYTSLENTKSYCRSHCWLQKRPSEVSLTVQYKQKRQAAFSHHTPHFLRIRYVRWDYALITILPRALGTEVLFPR